MNARHRLEQYLGQVRTRLARVIVARASAVAAAIALAVTCAAVWTLQEWGFPGPAVTAARIGLLVALLLVGAILLWRPLRKLRTDRGARELERHLPAQGGRIETYIEAALREERGSGTPLIELLAEDAAVVAEGFPPDRVVPARRMLLPGIVAALGLGTLALMMSLGSSYWGFGSRHLLLGRPIPVGQVAERQLLVAPGDATLRKNQDLPIRASVRGFAPSSAVVHVRFGDAQKWERAPMRPQGDGTFEFTLYALREPLSYYVTSAGVRSAEHRVEVVGVPRIERMRLTYVYPKWTGLGSRTDDSSRDIEAVAGTRVEFDVHTSEPLDSPLLVVNEAVTELRAEGAHTRGSLLVKRAGGYRLSARVGGELVPLTDEYSIAVVADEKPTIEVVKPGRDWRASSIEEVPIRVRATDDFRVQSLQLRYAVNGGEWKVVPLKARAKELSSGVVLRLEELGASQPLSAVGARTHLTPGDLVTYYAVAEDRRQQAQTDLFLIQVQPFERRFTQSQAAAAGQGEGGEDNAISERQREILLATWNLQRSRSDRGARGAQRLEDNARMLGELQSTLAEQARTLVQRTHARLLVSADEQIRRFVEHLEQAEQAMRPAAEKLNELELQQAIPHEQKALQHLLRAEALFTDIQVAFQQNNGLGGSQAGRDLAEMFELEMDLEKNQYETESPLRADTSTAKLEETLRKLRELARRQERLAREAANRQTAAAQEQRWKQEQLRRETEDLRRRLAELAHREGSTRESEQRQGRRTAARSAAEEALDQVEQALESMQGATGAAQGKGGEAASPDSAQEASRRLRRALDEIERGRGAGLAGTFDDFKNRARELLDRQHATEQELEEAFSGGRDSDARQARGSKRLDAERMRVLAGEKRQMQTDLQALEREMRAAIQRHRQDAPRAARQLGEAVRGLEESGTDARLGRSAIDIEQGRALAAAARERLITEALQALDGELGQAAQVAAGEARGERGQEAASTDELLAELGELRRAWEQAERGRSGRAAAQIGGPPGALQDGNPSHFIEGERGRLHAWNPPLAADAARWAQSPELREQAESSARRLQSLERRLPRGALADDEIKALRELARRLRGSADPMQSQYAEIVSLVDQLELAALKAAGGPGAATRAAVPPQDSPRYRENVAEYYRRLGGD